MNSTSRLPSDRKIYPKVFLITLTLLYFSMQSTWGQRASWEQRPTLQVGVEGGILFESQLLQNFSSSTLDESNNILLEANTRTGIRFGGFLRWRYYNNQNIESGIYRISRKYRAFAREEGTGDELAREEVSSVGFEIPLVWTVGIRTSNTGYLYAGFGGIGSFLVSDFGVFTGDIQLTGIADPRFVGGMLVVAGYEWDWGSSGGLYLGSQFQHSFGRMGSMRLRYRSGTDTLANGVLDLNGSYISVVLRYMLPGS